MCIRGEFYLGGALVLAEGTHATRLDDRDTTQEAVLVTSRVIGDRAKHMRGIFGTENMCVL